MEQSEGTKIEQCILGESQPFSESKGDVGHTSSMMGDVFKDIHLCVIEQRCDRKENRVVCDPSMHLALPSLNYATSSSVTLLFKPQKVTYNSLQIKHF
jgi:hypothetical protein